MGFDNVQSGISAWEEMLTYGKGPWITPTMSEQELGNNSAGRDLYFWRFGDGSSNQWSKTFGYADNISFESGTLTKLEAALQGGNDEEVYFNTFRTMILIMHETGHWARSEKAHKTNRTGGVREDGALAEEALFGRRFSNTNNLKDGDNADAVRNDLIRATSRTARSLWSSAGINMTSYFRKLATPTGQIGDPVLKAANIKEGKVFTSKSAKSIGNNSTAGHDYTY